MKITVKKYFYYVGAFIIIGFNSLAIRMIMNYEGWFASLFLSYLFTLIIQGGIYVSANLIHKPNEAYIYSSLFHSDFEQARLAFHSSIISLIVVVFFYFISGANN